MVWDDEIRIALEERASMPPDALSGMEANLRFTGRETLETRIFGRLSLAEEGRHLWAMVYLLHKHFGRDGREEAEALLECRSHPRILGVFNECTPDWRAFFMFTYFTDRDGKFQLNALAESGFDPLSRFMLAEEAHHMFVGESGVSRAIQRTCEVMRQHGIDDPAELRRHGVIDLPTVQRYLNFHYSVTIDLFGADQSSNAATFYSAGLKGRFGEGKRDDGHVLKGGAYRSST